MTTQLRHSLVRNLLALLVILIPSILSAQSGTPAATPLANDGIRFIENRGQVISTLGDLRPDILYTAEGKGVKLFFRKTGVSYLFIKAEGMRPPTTSEMAKARSAAIPMLDTGVTLSAYRMDMDLVGANPDAVITAEEPQQGFTNYYLAHCPDGITGVRSFGKVIYHDIYPSIDLVFYSAEGGLKYDFVVRPGGRVSDIRMRYTGADDLRAARDGKIIVTNPFGTVTEGKPLLYQGGSRYDGDGKKEGSRAKVQGRYAVKGENEITFAVGKYDPAQVLVVDPSLMWSTYYGGTSSEYSWSWGGGGGGWGGGCNHDPSGNIVTLLASSSANFPTTPGVFQPAHAGGIGTYDFLIVKFDPQGRLIWATYFGGTTSDYPSAMDIDATGDIVIAGHGGNNTFPVSPGAWSSTPAQNGFSDGVLIKLDSNGGREWATFVQGGNCADVVADRNGDIMVVGEGTSSMVATPGTFGTVPPPNGFYAPFVSRFTSGGNRTWNTFFGGTAGLGFDEVASGVAVDSNLNIVITGTTGAPDFPTTAGAFQSNRNGANSDAFVAKLDGTGNRVWATYFGGTQIDYGADVVVDSSDNIIITGSTYSSDLPITGNAFQGAFGGMIDAFVAKFTSTGAQGWATYYGGNDWEYGGALCVDPKGNYWFTGHTTSGNFPVTGDAYQLTHQSPAPISYSDAYVAKLSSAGGQLWSSYLGGNNWDNGSGIAANHIGVVVNGSTYSTTFPVTSGAFQTTHAGFYDGFVTKFCDPTAPMSIIRPTRFCQGDSTILSVPAGFDTYLWSNGANTRSITVTQAGTYSVTVGVGSCTVSSDPVTVSIFPTIRRVVGAAPSSSLCEGDSTVLGIGGGMRSYRWSTGAITPTITVKTPGQYHVTFVDTNGCTSYSDTITISLNPRPSSTIAAMGPLTFCQWEELMLDAGAGFRGYAWSTGDSLQHLKVTRSGTYGLRVRNEFGCWGSVTPVTVKVNPQPSVKISSILPTVFCDGDSTILSASPGFASYEWSNGARTQNVAIKKEGRYSVIATDTNGCRDTAEATVQVTPRPVPKITANGPTRFCQGDSVVLSTTGGFSRYQWATGAETQNIVVKRSGIYYVIAMSDQGCPGISDTISVTVLDRPVAAISGPSTVCRNSIATYSIPHVAGQSYEWQVTGAGGEIRSGAGTNQINVQWGPSGSGTVALSVRNDSTGCKADTTITVQISTSLTPVVTANGSLKLCEGESVTLDAGSYSSYTWSTGATTRTITVTQPGNYTVSVVDAKGCSGTSAPTTVTVNTATVPVITPANNGKLCPGGTLTLDAGAGYTNYRWSNGALGQRISISREGSYTVTVTDSNGCTATSEPIDVVLLPAPVPPINGPIVVCQNSTIGYSTPALSGATYTWTVTGGTLVNGQSTDGITVRWGGVGEGTIDLVITTAEGCTGAAEQVKVSVGDRLEPVVTPSGTVALCAGESVTLDAGAGYANYLWSTGATTRTLTVSDPQVVTVTVSDSNGCSGTSAAVSVEAKDRPAPVIVGDGPLELCEGDSVVLRTTEVYASYAWTTGAVTPTIKVRRSGSYGVRVTTSEGCSGDAQEAVVTVHTRPAKPVIASRGDTLMVANPLSGATYQWSFNGTDMSGPGAVSLFSADTGLYRVRVTDQFGCGAESDPYRLVGAPVITEHGVWIDTVSATVGERVRLALRLDPPLAESEGVTGYRAVLHVDPRALFFHSAIAATGPAVTGNGAQLRYRADGTMTVEGNAPSGALAGAVLFELDLEGLVTGSPLNIVTVDSVTFTGNARAVVIGDGLVILSGCEMGADFGRLVRIEGIRPNPASSDVVVRYRGPVGGELRLRVLDGVGREQSAMELPMGNGDEQEVRVRVEELPSGVYMLELRNGGERSALPIIIKK